MQNYPFQVPSGITIIPDVSGQSYMGTVDRPFGTIYSNQYATSLFQPTAATGSTTINWNNGSSQYLDYTGVVSGTSTLTLSNGIAGSTYLLKTKQNASGTITPVFDNTIWQGNVSGVMTNLSGSIDLFSFMYDGSQYLADAGNRYY